MIEEQWKPADGYEDRFEISSYGRIRSADRRVNNWPSGIRVIKGKDLKCSVSNRGYRYTQIKLNEKRINVHIHRLVAETFIDNPKGYPCVNHIDGDKLNNYAENLEWCTHQQNMRHAFDNGLATKPRTGKGDLCCASKLNGEQVKRIKERVLNGESVKRIAIDYQQVSESAIREIKAGRSWGHIIL